MNATVVSLCTLLSTVALGQVSATCDQPHAVDKYQLLRRLSLDLRGHVPSYEEYLALDSQSTVPSATIAGWIGSDDFRLVARRTHEDMFWPNVSNVRLNNTNSALTTKADEPAWSIASTSRRKGFRGDPDVVTTADGKQCGDFEQTHFLPGPDKKPDPAYVHTSTMGSVTVRQEGWRMVAPYWAPGTPIKVCAYDAQETLTATLNGNQVSCGDASTNSKTECGCGPNLQFCFGPTSIVAAAITASMREQLNRVVDTVTTGGKPYTDLLLARKVMVNGPLAFWKKHLASNYSLNRVYSVPDPTEPLPEMDFTDTTTWQTIDRGSDMHAGALTTAAYLLRFQTNRGRANRMRIDFECESFVPPAQLTQQPGCALSGTDLTGRCSCQYCHQQLEPLAAHFGQFSEAGTTLMTDLTRFPRKSTACVNSNSTMCNRYYVVNDEGDNPGALLPYQYADAQHPEIGPALAGGPRTRAQEIIDSGAFARCTVKRTFGLLMKRDMRVVGDQTDELGLLTTLSDGFKTNGYSYPWLVQQVVSRPEYGSQR